MLLVSMEGIMADSWKKELRYFRNWSVQIACIGPRIQDHHPLLYVFSSVSSTGTSAVHPAFK